MPFRHDRLAMNIAGADLPDDLLYWTDDQTWARLRPDGTAVLGITALGLKASGELYMCRPKSVGQQVEQGRSMAVAELAKSIVAVKSPLSGEVLRVNERLAADPGLIERDPYGEGWLVELRPSALASERAALDEGAAIQPAMEHYAWLNKLHPQ